MNDATKNNRQLELVKTGFAILVVCGLGWFVYSIFQGEKQKEDKRERVRPEVTRLLEEAARASQTNDHQKAIELTTQALAIDDQLEFAYYYRGTLRLSHMGATRSYTDDGVSAAEADFQKAIRLTNDNDLITKCTNGLSLIQRIRAGER